MGTIGPNNYNQPQQPSVAPKKDAGTDKAPAPQTQSTPTPVGVPNGAVRAGGDMMLAPFLTQQTGFSPQQLGMLLRNLLQMPKEVVQLLSMMTLSEGPVTPQLLRKLMSENPRLPLENLQQFLQENAKFQGKLLKLLQSSQMSFSSNSKNMGDLMNHASQLLAKAAESPTQALHTTIALYLPWYPLDPPQQFHLHFEPAEGEEGGGDEDAYQLVMFVETISMGLFKIVIGMQQQTQLVIKIEHDMAAEPSLGLIESDVTEGLRNDNLPPPEFTFTRRASSPQQPFHNEHGMSHIAEAMAEGGPRQSIGVHPVGGVSVLVINASYLIARVIFEADNRQSLHHKRSREI